MLGQMHALGPQVCGAVGQQAAPAEAVRAGEHDRAVQQAQADGAAVLRLQLIRGRRRRLQALHAGTRPIMPRLKHGSAWLTRTAPEDSMTCLCTTQLLT